MDNRKNKQKVYLMRGFIKLIFFLKIKTAQANEQFLGEQLIPYK